MKAYVNQCNSLPMSKADSTIAYRFVVGRRYPFLPCLCCTILISQVHQVYGGWYANHTYQTGLWISESWGEVFWNEGKVGQEREKGWWGTEMAANYAAVSRLSSLIQISLIMHLLKS